MLFIRWLFIAILVAAYGSLLALVGMADQRSREFNNPDGDYYLRSGYNPVFHPGEYATPTNLPLLLSPYAHLALAQQAATDGQMAQAKQHAVDALKISPANGAISLMLFELFTRPDLYRVVLPPTGEVTDTPDPPPINRLAYAALSAENRKVAETLAHIIDTLRPSYAMVQGPVSDYWASQGKPEKAIKGWSVLLSYSSSGANSIFPLLHTAMTKPEMTGIIQQYMDKPPTWWKNFFNYLLEHETDPQKIQAFYQTRQKSATPIDPYERDVYVNYLIKQNRWDEAHKVWDENLRDGSDPALLLYDGGFESTTTSGAFAWNINQPISTTVRRDNSNGITKKQALRVALRGGKSIAFAHVWQTLTLLPGNYTLTGRYRLDQLKTSKGLRWRIRCMDATSTLVAESEAFKGQSGWTTFKQAFTVPTGCAPQMLRLESDSAYPHENVFDGEIWFDDLAITVTP
jgi:hypothetical protein